MIGALILGALVGWIAGKLMNVEGGLLRNIVIGVVGSFGGQRGIFSDWIPCLRPGGGIDCGRGGRMPLHLAGKKALLTEEKRQNDSAGSNMLPGAQPFFRGKVQMKRVSRAELSARMAPLCASMMVLAIARPRPKPDFSPRDASAR